MTIKQKKFWNNWAAKDILQVILLVVALVVSYVRLEAKVESNKALIDQTLLETKEDIKEIKEDIKDLRDLLISKKVSLNKEN